MTDAPRPPETLQALELALAAARREAALEAPAREVLTRNARLLEEQIGLDAAAAADLQGDHQRGVRILSDTGRLREYGGNLASGALIRTEQLARLHDAESARRGLAALGGGRVCVGRATGFDSIVLTTALSHIDAQRWSEAAAELEALDLQADARPITRAARPARVWPLLAVAWATAAGWRKRRR